MVEVEDENVKDSNQLNLGRKLEQHIKQHIMFK